MKSRMCEAIDADRTCEAIDAIDSEHHFQHRKTH